MTIYFDEVVTIAYEVNSVSSHDRALQENFVSCAAIRGFVAAAYANIIRKTCGGLICTTRGRFRQARNCVRIRVRKTEVLEQAKKPDIGMISGTRSGSSYERFFAKQSRQ